MDFSSIFTKNQLTSLPTTLELGQGKNNTFCAKRFLRSRVLSNWCFRPVSGVRKIIDFYREYMNPWHVLEAIETLKTWFLQIPRKVKLRLKAGLFGDPVLTLFFEKRCKNVPIVIIVSPAWKWLSSECRNCDVSTTYSSCLLMKWQCRRFAHPCPAGICLVVVTMTLSCFLLVTDVS